MHVGTLEPSVGLQELTVICQEHDESLRTMRDGMTESESTTTTASYVAVLEESLTSTAEEREQVRGFVVVVVFFVVFFFLCFLPKVCR